MKYTTFSHRHAESIIDSDKKLLKRYNELLGVLDNITDEDLINDFHKLKSEEIGRNKTIGLKSMTPSINRLIKERMLEFDGWQAEVDIFNDKDGLIGNTEWRLDFACDDALCVEVAFNHGEAIAWNLLKPVLACELNHVQKAVQGQIGIYICATDKMKKAANIDSASGSFEKVLRYLPPMMNQLTVPIMVIGLEPFETFYVDKVSKEIVRI